MRNIRIWAEDNKRCEASWLGYLLTLCGCQVWKGQIAGESTGISKNSGRHRYVDILLAGDEADELSTHFLEQYTGGIIWYSGEFQSSALICNNPYVRGFSEELQIDRSESIKSLMCGLCEIITENSNERISIMRLADSFVQQSNMLPCCIYTISEMFCSRRIDYSEYDNIGVLFQAISAVEEWLKNFTHGVDGSLTYPEMFTIVYLQNLLDEGYVKARKRGGYDTSLLLRNANYILKYESEASAVQLLKLKILHNCINFSERPDDILQIILEQSEQEYISEALCEMGDIFREDGSKVSDREAVEYYEAVDQRDIGSYRGLYRAGLAYEEKAKISFEWYEKAKEKYEQVVGLIERIKLKDRNPQEFEYLHKAQYGVIKMSVELDKANERLTQEKKDFYQKELELLIEECAEYNQIVFLKKMYDREEVYHNIQLLMDEKMNKVKSWAKDLMREVV